MYCVSAEVCKQSNGGSKTEIKKNLKEKFDTELGLECSKITDPLFKTHSRQTQR